MRAFHQLCRFFLRFRYPVSLPEDIAKALGIYISNFITFEEFVKHLTKSGIKPTRLAKFMPRELAEEAFKHAQCRERFQGCSLYSFYFPEGWLEFALEFDDCARLRRVYMNHKQIKEERGIEIPLNKDQALLTSNKI